MLEYEWGTQMISNDEHQNDSSNHNTHGNNNQFYDQHYYTDQTQLGFAHPTPTPISFQNPDPHFLSAWPYAPMMQSSDPDPTRFMIIPKVEHDYSSHHIGLNLGGRTYFSSAESEFMNRLYHRSPGSVNTPRCQAEGCHADLTHAKHYHRRHKVCEFHSKAAAVITAGLTQRFCQQCSRFHLLAEFDNGKRSCRRRLADHNRRRRKSNQANKNKEQQQTPNSNSENALSESASDSIARSPQDSGNQSTSSVTLAISPPQISLDCFGQRSYQGGAAATSSPSTSSFFFTND